MKFVTESKRFLAGFLAVMMIFANVSCLAPCVHATEAMNEYYKEDFETGYSVGDAVQWTPRNTGNTKTTLSVAADNTVMKLEQPSAVGSSQWFTEIFDSTGATGNVILEFDVMASANADTFVIVSDAANSKNISQLCLRDNSYFCMNTGDGYPWNHKISPDAYLTADNWYHVKYEFDTSAKTYTVAVDDQTAVSFSYRESAENIGAIRVGVGGSTKDVVCFDNFKVTDADTDTVIYSESFESGYAVGESIAWTPRNSGNAVTKLTAECTNKSVCVAQPSTVGSSQWFTKVFNSDGLKGKYEVTFKIKADNAANTFFFLTDAANSKSIAQLCIRDNSYFCLDMADGYPWNHKVTEASSFVKGQWYDVRFVVDTDEKTFEVSVDGGSSVTKSFREAATDLGAIRIGVGGSTTDTVYIDDIVVKDYVDASADEDVEDVKEEKVIYIEDFESATTDEWTGATNSSGSVSIVDMSTVENADGSKALNVNKTSTGGGSYLVNKDLPVTLDEGIVTVQVKMLTDKADATSYFLLTNGSSTAVAQFGLYGTEGIVYQIGAGKVAVKPYEVNRWYTFKAVFDTEAKKYNLYVDGEIIASEVAYSASTDISRIRVGMYNFSKGNVYFDDISVVRDTRDPEYVTALTAITTLVGTAPTLNDTVTVKDMYEFSHEFEVTWEEIDPSQYKKEGSFDVNGVLENGMTVTQTINVIKSAVTDVYDEDFEENGAVDVWNGSNADVDVTQSACGDGNTAAKIGKTDSKESTTLSYLLGEAFGDAYTRVSVSAKLLVKSTDTSAYFAVSDSDGNDIARVDLYSEEGTVSVRNYGGTNALGYYGFEKYAADKWYEIKFVFYPAQERFNVYVNDAELMSNLAYNKLGAVIEQLEIGVSNTDAGDVYFDDVKVTSYTTEQSYTSPALNITTLKGTKPVLPELVSASYEDGFVETWSIKWDDVDASLYAKEGSFAVNGTATSFISGEICAVKATVNVRKNSNIKYYVDPVNGDDENDGTTAATAFKTIGKAQAAVRLVNGSMTGDINVYLMDGVYNITEAIRFTSEDSGTNGYYVRWQALDGASPVFSGGKSVSGWRKVDGKAYYVVSVPESDGYLDNVRQLYVDGERAVRASSGWINAKSFVKTGDTYTGVNFANSDIKGGYTNVEDILVAHVSSFKYEEWHVASVNEGDAETEMTVVRDGDELFSWRANTLYCQTTDKYMIVNAFEELDAEGEWYLDRENDLIYYYPYADQDMSAASAYVTVMETDQMLMIEGTTSDKVENLIFDGLAFEYSNWLYPFEYSIGGSQAEALWGIHGMVRDISYGGEVAGAVRLNHTENIEILNCTLSHLAGGGIHVYNDAANTLIEGNVTFDTTAAGIMIGRFCGAYLNDDRVETESFTGDNLEGRVKDTVVRNNLVTDSGRDFLQATGISVMSALRTTVMNNVIDNSAYMGIHIRLEVAGQYLTRTNGVYNGDPTDTTLDVGQTIVAYNRIEQANWAHGYGLNDNGAIYNFGPSAGSLVYRNYVTSESSADWGFYNDNNSHNVIWAENVISGKNLYISNRCVDKNTIILKNNHHIGFVVDGSCIASDNSTVLTDAGEAVIAMTGLTSDYAGIAERLPDESDYHEVYATYQSLNRTTGKITDGNEYSVPVVDGEGTNTQSAHPAEHAFDGYLSTYWGSGTSFPETLTVELESEEELNNIEIYWYDPTGRYYQYRIYTSVTGADGDWQLACDRTDNTTMGFTRDYLDDVSAKYIKIEITKSSRNSAAIREIIVNRSAGDPTEIVLDRTSVELTVGREVTLEATVLPTNTDGRVIWTSSDESVVTVENGTVKAIGVGTATVTAETVNGLTAICAVTVVGMDDITLPDPIVKYEFEGDEEIVFDKNGNVYVDPVAGADGTGGLVIKDTYNALEWNNGVQSPENSDTRDEKVSGTVENPLKGNTSIHTSGVTISYDRYMPADHNGYESIVRFGDYDVTIQSGWFMFEPANYSGKHFCFNRDTASCSSTVTGVWVTETYTFDPVTDTVSLYRDGVLVARETAGEGSTQIADGEIAIMMQYLSEADDITFGGAASWFSTLGVVIDNFAVFDEVLSEDEVFAYAKSMNTAYGQLEIVLKQNGTEVGIEGAVFEIIDENGNVVATVTTDENGIAVSNMLAIGITDDGNIVGKKTYFAVQIKTAKGYAVDEEPKEIIFEYDESDGIYKATVEIVNDKIPQTGIFSEMIPYIALACLMGAVLLKRRKRIFE